MRESFIIYKSFIDAGREIKNKVDRLSFYESIFQFALTGEEIPLEGVSKAMFMLVKPQLLANQKRYENGNKGGKPPTETPPKTEPNPNLDATKPEPNKNKNKNINKNLNKNKTEECEDSLDSDEISKTDFEIALDAFYEMRIKIKKPATEFAKKLILSQLDKLAPNDDSLKIELLNQSILNSWQDIYPLKNKTNTNGTTKQHSTGIIFDKP